MPSDVSSPSPVSVPGEFYDGHTAAAQPVTVRAEIGRLVIEGDRLPETVTWPAEGVRLATPPGASHPQLRLGRDHPARLGLTAEALNLISRHLPNLSKRDGTWRGTWRPILLFLSAAAVSVWLLVAFVIPSAAGYIAKAIPAEWEEKMGEETRDQVVELLAALEDRDGASNLICRGRGATHLSRYMGNLWADAGLPSRPLRLTIVNLELANAFALPGRYIVLTRGLIEQADHGNEVAGVLAHELGHVVHNHPIEHALEATATSTLFGLLVGDLFGGTLVAGLGSALINTAYSRDAEREADAWAVEQMNRAGIDAKPLAGFFQRLHDEQGSEEKAISLISSHPLSSERADEVLKTATGARDAFRLHHWDEIKRICD